MRGQSDIIISIIAFSIMLTAVLPLAYTLYTRIYTSYQQPTVEESRKTVVELGRVVAEGTLNISAIYPIDNTDMDISIINNGGSRIDITRIFIAITCGNDYQMIIPNLGPISIGSGESRRITSINITRYSGCRQYSVRGVYALTSEGNIVSARLYNLTEIKLLSQIGGIQQSVLGPKAYVLTPLSLSDVNRPWYYTTLSWNLSLVFNKGFSLGSIDSMTNPTKVTIVSDPRQLLYSSGMVGGDNYVWVLVWSESAVRQVVFPYTCVRNLFIGYDIQPNQYIIILTGDTPVIVNGVTYCADGNGYRVRIYGFRSTSSSGIMLVHGDVNTYSGWITTLDSNIARFMYLGGAASCPEAYAGSIEYILGQADRIEVFCRIRTSSGETGYYPYISLFGGKPGDSLGILFTTEDRIWGYSYSANEGARRLQDCSKKPFVLVYTGDDLFIGRNVSAISIIVNYAFHDNAYDDEGDITFDAPILVVGIVDDKGNVVSYRSFSFRELTRYENTFPPVAQLQSVAVFIPIPSNTDATRFYPFIAFQDPYCWKDNNYKDDVDITLYIDSIAVIPYIW